MVEYSRAILCKKYGPPEVLQLSQVIKPVPGNKEVLVKIYATTVTAGDTRIRSFTVPLLFWIPARLYLGIRKPRRPVLGVEIAGEIEAVGKDVKKFKKGDLVMASTAGANLGGYAEYKCLPEGGVIAIKPPNISFPEAAAIPIGGATALGFLRKGKIEENPTSSAKPQKVLIYGASGSVGTYAVQLARYFGAEVTAVCSGSNLALVKSLGAQQVIDYTRESFMKSGESYDIIFDAVGKISKSECKGALTAKGVFVSVMDYLKEKPEYLLFLKELAEAGKIKPVIDRSYSLEQIAEAHRYVDKGRKKGNVVVIVRPDL